MWWGCCSWHQYQFEQVVKWLRRRRGTCIGAMQTFDAETWRPAGKLWRFYRLDIPMEVQ